MTHCRHLDIMFDECGDVHYAFGRHGGAALSKYVIEWPAHRVTLHNREDLEAAGFLFTTDAHGQLLLRAPRADDAAEPAPDAFVHYTKHGLLQGTAGPRGLWRYREEIRIRPRVRLYLHEPNARLSAVRGRCTATFEGREMRPVHLAQAVFDTPGVLKVDWLLELDPGKPARMLHHSGPPRGWG